MGRAKNQLVNLLLFHALEDQYDEYRAEGYDISKNGEKSEQAVGICPKRALKVFAQKLCGTKHEKEACNTKDGVLFPIFFDFNDCQ